MGLWRVLIGRRLANEESASRKINVAEGVSASPSACSAIWRGSTVPARSGHFLTCAHCVARRFLV
jgi:hypothetical protein